MKSGIDRTFTRRKSNVITIPIGVNGVGEEKHPTIDVGIPQYQRDPIEEKVFNIVNGMDIKPETDEEIPSKLKLYLNTIINLLFNKKEKDRPSKPSLYTKASSKIVNWWRKDTTESVADLVKFVSIHGLLGASTLLSALTIFDIDIVIVQIIRRIVWLTVILYIVGAGSGYYLFLDVNKALDGIWRKEEKK